MQHGSSAMKRLEPLDWLRGLLALSIMIYHLISWKYYPPGADELLGRLGIYGVSMFFVLSGLTTAAVSFNFTQNARTAARFFVRRVFKIWPLLWLAVVAVTLGGGAFKGEVVNWPLVLLNLTTLFGFVNPGGYINTGVWSIGNEMVSYALTPTLLAIYYRNLILDNATVMLTIIYPVVDLTSLRFVLQIGFISTIAITTALTIALSLLIYKKSNCHLSGWEKFQYRQSP